MRYLQYSFLVLLLGLIGVGLVSAGPNPIMVSAPGLPFSGGTLTGSLLLPDGTLTSPSLAFSSTNDGTVTGIYLQNPANDQIGLVSNGWLAMTINQFSAAMQSGAKFNLNNGLLQDGIHAVNIATYCAAAGSTGDVCTGGSLTVDSSTTLSGGVVMSGISADLVAGACTAGTMAWDTGGATVELCYCNTINNWECFTPTTTNGPAD